VGNLLEESVQALQLLFNERSASWHGTYYHFEDVEMYPEASPKPTANLHRWKQQKCHPPGTAKYAQGWMGAGMPAAQIREFVAQLREAARRERARSGCD
jgi:alkanesulfonate monooxygenase SsuD/methylene tetrahydromethanopterin reductase-like flavin-dependent oxidoreductase (luciferase family)